MADLLIIPDAAHSSYEPWDILAVANNKDISCQHASRLCDRRNPRFRNNNGYLSLGTLAEKWFLRTHQYRWERASSTEIRRVNQWTLDEIVYGATPIQDPDNPNGPLIHCNVKEFFARRVKSADHAVFGEAGSEVYYCGGRKDFSASRLTTLWRDITTDTGLQESDFPHCVLSTYQLKRMLAVTVDDFDDATAADLISPILDETDPENPIKLKARKNRGNLTFPLLGITENNVRDRRMKLDLRPSVSLLRSLTVEEKTV